MRPVPARNLTKHLVTIVDPPLVHALLLSQGLQLNVISPWQELKYSRLTTTTNTKNADASMLKVGSLNSSI
jgi:hypothetical protein